VIVLSAQRENCIRSEGERSYPNECCGILLGRIGDEGSRVVEDLIPIENGWDTEEQYHRFQIEPEDMMRAERVARRRGLDVLGFYHSHPDHPAKPSDFDREQALPFYSYIIVAVEKGRAGDFASWELKTDRSEFLGEAIKRV
jgi:proteasome lid subunit RPN8/RPN11